MYKSEAFPCGQANTQGRKLPPSAEAQLSKLRKKERDQKRD